MLLQDVSTDTGTLAVPHRVAGEDAPAQGRLRDLPILYAHRQAFDLHAI